MFRFNLGVVLKNVGRMTESVVSCNMTMNKPLPVMLVL